MSKLLSEMEWAVLQHVLAGLSIKAIARRLDVTVKTVCYYRSAIKVKLLALSPPDQRALY